MGKARLEAFSDGVIAIIITIMVLELRVPAGESFSALIPLFPVFVSYVLSFVYVGIYWNNHHHMLHRACIWTPPRLQIIRFLAVGSTAHVYPVSNDGISF